MYSTNNWSDYGGMDVYTKQLTGSLNHDVFYTNALTQAAYKSYVSTWVGRYKNEPTILAWELGPSFIYVLLRLSR
jgi:mannan endo-1,4-beta-mannosidase